MESCWKHTNCLHGCFEWSGRIDVRRVLDKGSKDWRGNPKHAEPPGEDRKERSASCSEVFEISRLILFLDTIGDTYIDHWKMQILLRRSVQCFTVIQYWWWISWSCWSRCGLAWERRSWMLNWFPRWWGTLRARSLDPFQTDLRLQVIFFSTKGPFCKAVTIVLSIKTA